MDTVVPPEWELSVRWGCVNMRTGDVIYHRVSSGCIDKSMRQLWELAIINKKYVPYPMLGKCELCDNNAMYARLDSCGLPHDSVCEDCLKSITDVKKFKFREKRFVCDNKFMRDELEHYYRHVPLKEIKNRLHMVTGWLINYCSLCGFIPEEYGACYLCYVIVVRFMISRVILLKDQLIDDILIAVVRSIAR